MNNLVRYNKSHKWKLYFFDILFNEKIKIIKFIKEIIK